MKTRFLALFAACFAAIAAFAAPTVEYAIVPNATVYISCDGNALKGTFLDKICKRYEQLGKETIAKTVSEGKDSKKLLDLMKSWPKEASQGGKVLASIDLSGISFDAEPDLNQIPFCIAYEFNVPVGIFVDKLIAELNQDKDFTKEVHIVKGKVAGLNGYDITFTDLPKVVFALAVTPNGKTFFFSTKAFLEKQLALPKAPAALPSPALIEALKGVDPRAQGGLVIGLSKNLLDAKNDFCAKEAKSEDAEDAAMAKNLIPLTGASLTLFSDATTIKLTLDASFANAEAPKFWKQIIDTKVIPPAKQMAPAMLGKEKIPCIETLACAVKGNHCNISLTITQADIDLIDPVIKEALAE